MLLGAVTYPLYLLHEDIGNLIFNRLCSSVNPHLLFWGTTALMLAAASLVHLGIERRYSKPLRKPIERILCHPATELRPAS
jgi:peptidoglycan/LPS O-acetylase OafA/YrhL